MIPVTDYLLLSAALFIIGVVGVLLRRNAIVIFLAIELMLNAVNIAFVGLARDMVDATGRPILDGQIVVLFVLAVAAAEVVVGLGIIVALYRIRKTLNVDDVSLMKW